MRIVNAGLLILMFSVGVFAQGNSVDAVVADVNGEKITVGDVLYEMGKLTTDAQQKILQDPNGKTELVNSIIRKKLLVAEAKSYGIDTLDFVKKAVQRSAEDIYAQVLLGTIQQQNSQVTDEEISKFYNDNDSLFRVPVRYHIAQIVLPDEKKAQDLYKKLKKGKISWDDAVKENPGMGNNKSGDAGWMFANQIVPAAQNALKDMSNGDISEPINVGSTYYIIKLIESEPERKLTLEEAKNNIAQYLSQKKGQNAIVDYQNKLYMHAKISIDNAVLNSINLGGQQAPPPNK
ncbi:peptidyl-prolyl cis-trans isomerase [bacterium]|nr:peptidyl-prolyl cis-trans isomerase [bacterium]